MQWILTHEIQILVHFALRLSISEIQGHSLEMHRVTSNWTWPLNSQKYTMYTKYLPMRSKFWPLSLCDQRFPRYCTFYNSPLTAMLKVQKQNKKKKKCQKSKNWNFTILYTTLLETLSRSMPKKLGANLLCSFGPDVGFFFSHMVPY